MVAELDPHSEYFPPKEYGEFTSETTGKFGGVGIEVDGRGEYLTVITPIEGGPAEAAGVKPGDEIVAIDNADAKGLSLEKSVRLMRGEWRWTTADPLGWEDEIERFFRTLKAVDDELASGAPIKLDPAKLIQGGLADALTHTGQLAMLRRLSGHKMKSESYAQADVVIGRVGLDQAAPIPRHEFD
jgi:hypothetical protein